jgi:hypothetical protein
MKHKLQKDIYEIHNPPVYKTTGDEEYHWRSPETAPRNGTQIIGDFGWPWPLPCAWDEYDEEWVVCVLQCCPMVDGSNNTYFETDIEREKNLLRWMPMPVLPTTKSKS